MMQEQIINLSGKAYDMLLDLQMNATKGNDNGCLEYGTNMVGQENKHGIVLKNRGKFEILYSFEFMKPQKGFPKDLQPSDIFTIVPMKGSLLPADRPVTVNIIFKCDR